MAKGTYAVCKVIILCLCVIFYSCIILTMLAGCSAGEAGDGRISETRLLLDTYCTITIHGTEDTAVLDRAFEICRELEALLSITAQGSDVWRINNAGGQPVEVDIRTLEVIAKGIEFGELSDGMFDITIGRLSRLWDFGSDISGVPPLHEIEDARSTVGYNKVHISPGIGGLQGSGTVQLEVKDAWIDLGGIAKGYIADEIAAFLSDSGIDSALIDLGGDIVAAGSRQDGSPWRLGIRKPFGESGSLIGVLEVSDAAVVSSGTYERQFVDNGTLYHHILDPNTGMPATSDIIGATIIADTAMTGEGLSTIAVLAGSERLDAIFEQTQGFIGAVIVLDSFEVLTFGDVEFIEGEVFEVK